MSYGKAVEEVWEWRESLEKELVNVPLEERGRYLNKKGVEIYTKYNLSCPIIHHEPTHS
jgi:hypothetical protein